MGWQWVAGLRVVMINTTGNLFVVKLHGHNQVFKFFAFKLLIRLGVLNFYNAVATDFIAGRNGS